MNYLDKITPAEEAELRHLQARADRLSTDKAYEELCLYIDSLKRKYGPRRSCPGCKTHASMIKRSASFWQCFNCGHLERDEQ